MKQKTLFKIIILALCIIVLFFVFDKDNNASNNINNISKNDLAFKYDKNDDRLESLFDAIDNNEKNLGGRVLVFNPKPNFPSSFSGKLVEDGLNLYTSGDNPIYSFNFDFSCGNADIVGLNMYICSYDTFLSDFLNCIVDQEGNIRYDYLPYFVLPMESYYFEYSQTVDEVVRLVMDEILLITKDPIFTQGDVY